MHHASWITGATFFEIAVYTVQITMKYYMKYHLVTADDVTVTHLGNKKFDKTIIKMRLWNNRSEQGQILIFDSLTYNTYSHVARSILDP